MTAVSGTAWVLVGVLSVGALAVAWLVLLQLRGVATLDLRLGRSIHALGPIVVRIEAPRELVFEQLSAPYLGRTPSGLREKLEVLERGSDMVLAAHRTKLRWFTSTTVETVRFTPPERIDFRHVRGPAPYVVESFLLREVDGGTQLEYTGDLGLDLWWLGRLWGRRSVVPVWNRVVKGSLSEVKAAAESRASSRTNRD